MKPVFFEVNSLDQRCYDVYGLSEDLLMEHAALALQREITTRFPVGSSVLIVTGSGNNGADGIALARILHPDYEVRLYLAMEPKSLMAQLQRERVQKIGLECVGYITDSDVIVDSLFGSGLNKPLDKKQANLIKKLNSKKGFKIACDIPSGINQKGQVESEAFYADKTITMGALKTSLFSDAAKDFSGEISIADLGISPALYAQDSPMQCLETSDLSLPLRTRQDSHKGSYGHLAVLCGNKPGAGIIAAQAGMHFGAGLTTLITPKELHAPFELMQSASLPENTTALCLGMGLGYDYDIDVLLEWLGRYSCVLDADLMHYPEINAFLETATPHILTPHPKEFTALLKHTGIGDIDIATLQRDRFDWVARFCEKYPQHTILLKGAHTLIGHAQKLYINPLGTNALAKGGSGDVLAGLIAALLAQGLSPLESTLQGSLAHAIASQRFKANSYALTPPSLIHAISTL